MARVEGLLELFIPEGPKMANVSHLRRDLRQPVRIYSTAPPANFKFVVLRLALHHRRESECNEQWCPLSLNDLDDFLRGRPPPVIC